MRGESQPADSYARLRREAIESGADCRWHERKSTLRKQDEIMQDRLMRVPEGL